jgi:RHS repeat-associated protein
MAEQHSNTADFESRYKFNGKELDPETGLYYYGARYYDPIISQWYSIDPLAEKYPGMMPYHYTSDNPISRIDPDGRSDNPIYDTDGNFLGTDDKGLQGEAIIMAKDNFTQGMSHDEAMKYNLGLSYLKHDMAAKTQLQEHYKGLPERPDYDGEVTFREAIMWYNKGTGESLYVDATKINLNATNVLEIIEDDDGYINFFPASHPNTGLVYGNIKITLLDKNTGKVKLGGAGNFLDIFDFDPNKPFGRIADGLYPGTPKKFNIYCTSCITKVRTESEVNEFRKQRNKILSEHPKF